MWERESAAPRPWEKSNKAHLKPRRHAPQPLINRDREPALPAAAAAATAGNMDTSQQTPTQLNDDRDYAAFCNPISSSPVDKPTQRLKTNDDEPRTLKEGDTGAVHFGSLGDFIRPSSQVSEDAGLDTTRSGWRVTDRASQQASNPTRTPHKPHSPPPETPALPKNPFAADRVVSAPLAGSQLFRQTQQLSSAAKAISPISSRPSPNVLLDSISPNVVETSPLKNRANVSSPTDVRTSSPQRLHEVPASLLKGQTGAAAPDESPVPSGSPPEEVIPESPTNHALKTFPGRQPLAQAAE
ncbi:hypothetical protein CDD83_528 [Cordyceps sp. RAO-2017]|nr:hypothetical protein CDD83_528 [Cordyceps sp. RAO-2017]